MSETKRSKKDEAESFEKLMRLLGESPFAPDAVRLPAQVISEGGNVVEAVEDMVAKIAIHPRWDELTESDKKVLTETIEYMQMVESGIRAYTEAVNIEAARKDEAE